MAHLRQAFPGMTESDCPACTRRIGWPGRRALVTPSSVTRQSAKSSDSSPRRQYSGCTAAGSHDRVRGGESTEGLVGVYQDVTARYEYEARFATIRRTAAPTNHRNTAGHVAPGHDTDLRFASSRGRVRHEHDDLVGKEFPCCARNDARDQASSPSGRPGLTPAETATFRVRRQGERRGNPIP